MDFLELAKQRCSVRKFADRPVPQELTEQILAAGLAAPTAHNYQPERIIAVRSPEGLERFRRCTECHYHAPLAFIISHDRETCWKREYDGKSSGDIDASIVTTHMMLEAASLGLGTTWLMYFDPAAVRREFSLPEEQEPTALLVVGWPAEGYRPSPMHFDRRPAEELVSYR